MRLRDELARVQIPARIRWGGFGELAVTVDGRTVFSKRQTGRLPEAGEIPRLVQSPRG